MKTMIKRFLNDNFVDLALCDVSSGTKIIEKLPILFIFSGINIVKI